MRLFYLLTLCCLSGLLPAWSMTLAVNPNNADGITTFSSLNQAAEYLAANNDVGAPDLIRVVVDRLVVGSAPADGAVKYNWDDDLTIDGDGDGNGIWCTLVCSENDDFNGAGNAEDAFFRLEHGATVAWTANVIIRNFIMIPKFSNAGAFTTVMRTPFSMAMGSNLATTGSVTLENLVITGSLPGDVAANPFVDNLTLATLWNRGLHSGSKSANSAQADTQCTFRNIVISHTRNQAVQWYGDNTRTTFGPGFVVAYTLAANSFEILNSAYANEITFSGTPTNRNLFYHAGDDATDAIFTLAGGTATGTVFKSIAYTDIVNCAAGEALRAALPVQRIDHALFSETGSNGVPLINLQAGTAQNCRISNSTFYNAGANATACFVGNVAAPVLTLSDVIFAAGRGEAAAANATADRALDFTTPAWAAYCLFPESGLWRLRGPYDTAFPPSPVGDAAYLRPNTTGQLQLSACSNADPQFISDALTSYPLPADLAAWLKQKVSLQDCNYLRPANTALATAGPAGTPLAGVYAADAAPSEIVGFSRLDLPAGVSIVGAPYSRGIELSAAGDLLPTTQTTRVWRMNGSARDEFTRHASGCAWVSPVTGLPLIAARTSEAWLVEASIPCAVYLQGGVRPAQVSWPLPAADGLIGLPWPAGLGATGLLGSPLTAATHPADAADHLFILQSSGYWGFFLSSAPAEWRSLEIPTVTADPLLLLDGQGGLFRTAGGPKSVNLTRPF